MAKVVPTNKKVADVEYIELAERPVENAGAKVIESNPVTSLADLKRYSNGSIVDLPEFTEGMPFRARIRRPSMLALANEGSIPNSLLSSASELFVTGRIGKRSENGEGALRDMFKVCEVMAKAALIEPSYDDVVKSGLQLTDQQLMAIFNFTQEGVKALDAFRKK